MQPENSSSAFDTDALGSSSGDVSVQIHSSGSPSPYPRLQCGQAQSSTYFCIVQPDRLQFQDISTAVISAACIYPYSVAISTSVALPQDSGAVLWVLSAPGKCDFVMCRIGICLQRNNVKIMLM